MLFHANKSFYTFLVLFLSLVKCTFSSVIFSEVKSAPSLSVGKNQYSNDIIDLENKNNNQKISVSKNYLSYENFRVEIPPHKVCKPYFLDIASSRIIGLIDNNIFLVSDTPTITPVFYKKIFFMKRRLPSFL